MSSLRFLFDSVTYSRRPAARMHVLLLVTLLLVLAISALAPLASSAASAHPAVATLLAARPQVQCPGLSLPC